MNHDRIHSREPTHHVDRWSVGTIQAMTERHGHSVITVAPRDGDDGPVELTVTMAVRDLFVSRLDIHPDESPIGERVWYRERGQ